jgi:antitoxin component of MazEF toxin-antitoxin module
MYEVTRKIHDQGGSFLVALPILWIRSKRLRSGDSVRMQFDDVITIQPVKKKEGKKDATPT